MDLDHYDYVSCYSRLLPKGLPEVGWATNDFECQKKDYRITLRGRLIRNWLDQNYEGTVTFWSVDLVNGVEVTTTLQAKFVSGTVVSIINISK